MYNYNETARIQSQAVPRQTLHTLTTATLLSAMKTGICREQRDNNKKPHVKVAAMLDALLRAWYTLPHSVILDARFGN